MKLRIVKFIRNVLISIMVLLVLFVGAGVAYTWYMGQNNIADAAMAAPVEAQAVPVIKRVQIAANAPESASIQGDITWKILPGSNTSITVKTNPESNCTITVMYNITDMKNKITSKDSGLVPKISDDYGMVSWAWTVEYSVPLGKGAATVKCSRDSKSAVVVGNLVVVSQID